MSSNEDVLTLSEMIQEYPDDWVAIRVAERDANDQPLSGTVLAHNRDKRSLREQTIGERDICIFYAGLSQVLVMI